MSLPLSRRGQRGRNGGSVSALLEAVPGSISAARAQLDEALTATGASSARRYEALLLLSEVLTNAIVHGSRSGDAVELTWTIAHDRLEVAVRDRARGVSGPVLLGGDTSQEGGRGLRVLDRLADRWNERIIGGRREVSFSLALCAKDAWR